MVDVFIGLGSNVGDREGNLNKAAGLLRNEMKLLKISSMYETEPMYLTDQPWFVNCVAKFETNLAPKELLERLRNIERRLGRQENVKYGPRSIDLDILFYGNEVINESDLKIPHPKLYERRFVLVPFVEIEPDRVHPIYGTSVAALLANLDSNERVLKLQRQAHGTSDSVA